MNSKKLLFSLLFLLLGTTVWADKYYMPRSYKSGVTPRLTLESLAGTGVKFMIYNTAINGDEDRTAFLRNNGTKVEYDKSKERDLFVYNESFVYTMEGFDTDSDGNFDHYAIKSVVSGTYVDVAGSTANTSPDYAKLYIYSWDEAASNGASKDGANMESWRYNVISNGKITGEGHGSTVFVITNGVKDTYWNGESDRFDTYEKGHPYAFHVVDEVTSGDYLQDLHIYSRCDIYSAQVIYGYVQQASQITLSPVANGADTGMLLDGDFTTSVTTGTGNSNHYFLFNLGKSTEEVYLYLQRDADATNVPATIKLQGSTDGTSFTDIPDGTISTGLGTNSSYMSGLIDLGAAYTHIRILNAAADAQMSLSEVSILPKNKKVQDAIEYIGTVSDANSLVYRKGTARQYTELMEEYNGQFPDARLLSGVPLPGNKYRIYADAYVDGAYKNCELYAVGDALSLANGGTYSSLGDDEQKKYEWYCEKTSDGYLVFKNVADGSYLANGAVSATPYKWSMNTVLTQRFGVPLKNEAEQYLAVFNDGAHWQGNVKEVRNQTVIPAIVDVNNTPEDDTDDTIVDCGLCTDFVFIPVEVDASEKKITFVANNLVQRNVAFSYDSDGDGQSEDIILPFSRMFLEDDALPEFTLRCSGYHAYSGCCVNGKQAAYEVVTETDGVYSFDFEKINDGDVIEIQLEFAHEFSYYGKSDGTGLYFIENKRRQSVPQQAPSIEFDDDRVSTASGNSYYAKFDTESTNMLLNENAGDDFSAFDASMLFYFEDTESNDPTYRDAKIHSAITPLVLAAADSWTATGATYYIQPHKTDSYSGYAIGRTPLGINNNPGDFLNSNHADGNKVIDWHANDDGSAWEFVEVTKDDARELLGNYIETVAEILNTTLDDAETTWVSNTALVDKIGRYKSLVGDLSTVDNVEISSLVTNAQKLTALKTELLYALQPLPEVSTPENPVWYYIKSVNSDGHYAEYKGDVTIPLDNGEPGLMHMFYFTGTSTVDDSKANAIDNHLSIDDYLNVKIHGFGSAGKTVIGKVENIYELTDYRVPGKNTITSGLSLGDSWTLTAEYDLDGTLNNAYGTALLASGKEPLGDSYNNGFQIYFKDDHSIVVKVNNADDRYRFWHTQDAFSHIKVVITKSAKSVTVGVYNAEDICETRTITGANLSFSDLSAAFPASGTTLTSLTIDNADAMTWGKDDDYHWYILPSSNVNKKGLAIVMEGADDSNMGWTNADGHNALVGIGAGNNDNSTWEIVKVDNFAGHIGEIAKGLKSAVYDNELVELCRTVKAETDCTAGRFNELYEAIRNYQDKNKLTAFTDIKRPEPDKFYTIRHLSDIMPNDLRVNELNYVRVDEDMNAGGLNSRGVWYFEGDAENGYFKLDSRLKLKSLHTQSSPYAAGFTAGSLHLSDSESAAALTIEPVEASVVRLKVGDKYLRTGSDGNIAAADAPLENADYVMTSFERVGNSAAASSLVVRSYNNGIVPSDLSATVGGVEIERYLEKNAIDKSILCPNANGNTSPTIVFTVTYSGLPAGFVLDNVGLDIHALNNSGAYLQKDDGEVRQWNLAIEVAEGEGGYSPFGGSTDIDIAKGIETGGKTHKVWDITGSYTKTGDGTLKVRLTVTKGTTNAGCFFGLSSILLNNPESVDTWYIEEVADADVATIKHDVEMKTKFSSVTLGYNATVPAGVEAYNAKGIEDGYVELENIAEVGGVIPANTPVILYIPDFSEAVTKTFKYTANSAENPAESLLGGSLYTKYVECDDNADYYKLMIKNNEAKMYLMYKEFNAEGVSQGATHAGGHIKCSANKIYMRVPGGNQMAMFGMRFVKPGATEIENVEIGNEKEEIFDLSGRKLTEITEPGIYIVNGKKVLVR